MGDFRAHLLYHGSDPLGQEGLVFKQKNLLVMKEIRVIPVFGHWAISLVIDGHPINGSETFLN